MSTEIILTTSYDKYWLSNYNYSYNYWGILWWAERLNIAANKSHCLFVDNNYSHMPNSSIICSAIETWNCMTSSPVGIISSGGKMKPCLPVSLSSIANAYGISASPYTQSIVPPEAGYNKQGMHPTS